MKVSLLLFPAFLTMVFASSSLGADEVIWTENFEAGLRHVSLAVPGEGSRKPELLTDGGADGGNYVRTYLTGVPSLEGVRVEVREVPTQRLVTTRLKARGEGAIMFSLRSGNSWAYTSSITLNNQWQELTASTVTSREAGPLGIYVHRPRNVFAEGVVDIDEVEVSVAPALELEDEEVRPIRIQAADYAKSATQIIATGEARGVGGKKPFVISNVPFPQTSRNVDLYLRVRPAGLQDRYAITSTRTGRTQTISTATPETGEGWQWLKIAALSAEEAGGEISIQGWPEANRPEGSVIEAIVFATGAALDGATLDAVH